MCVGPHRRQHMALDTLAWRVIYNTVTMTMQPVTAADYDTTQPHLHSTECKQTWYQWQTRIQYI